MNRSFYVLLFAAIAATPAALGADTPAVPEFDSGYEPYLAKLLLDAGTLPLLGLKAGLLEDLEQLPAATLALRRDRPPLRLEAGAGLGLPPAPHLPTREPASKARPSSATSALTATRRHLSSRI